MRLSADRINKKSPYWVIQLDELTFRFVTRNGILYRVGFYKDQYFLGSRAFHFFIANDSEASAPKDNVGNTRNDDVDEHIVDVEACAHEDFLCIVEDDVRAAPLLEHGNHQTKQQHTAILPIINER